MLRLLQLLGAILVGTGLTIGAQLGTTVNVFRSAHQIAPVGITFGHDGNIWFTARDGNAIGRMTPQGHVTMYGLPHQNSRALRIARGPGSDLWFTESEGNRIGRITLNGAITEYTLPTPGGHPYGICEGPDGNMWFVEFLGHRVGKISSSGHIVEFQLDISGGRGYPTAITMSTEKTLWVTATATLRTITTDGVIRVLPLRKSSLPNDVVETPGHNIWFTDENNDDGDMIGRINPQGRLTEYRIPTPEALPFGIAFGTRNFVWFTELEKNQIGRIGPNGRISEYRVPTPTSKPAMITGGPDGAMWFTESNADKIGRITPNGQITEFPLE